MVDEIDEDTAINSTINTIRNGRRTNVYGNQFSSCDIRSDNDYISFIFTHKSEFNEVEINNLLNIEDRLKSKTSKYYPDSTITIDMLNRFIVDNELDLDEIDEDESPDQLFQIFEYICSVYRDKVGISTLVNSEYGSDYGDEYSQSEQEDTVPSSPRERINVTFSKFTLHQNPPKDYIPSMAFVADKYLRASINTLESYRESRHQEHDDITTDSHDAHIGADLLAAKDLQLASDCREKYNMLVETAQKKAEQGEDISLERDMADGKLQEHRRLINKAGVRINAITDTDTNAIVERLKEYDALAFAYTNEEDLQPIVSSYLQSRYVMELLAVLKDQDESVVANVMSFLDQHLPKYAERFRARAPEFDGLAAKMPPPMKHSPRSP